MNLDSLREMKKAAASGGNTNWLETVLANNERQLKSALADARAKFDHGPTKGDACEAPVRQFLSDSLGVRYRIGHGQLVDREGNRSAECDIVIQRDESPLLRPEDGPDLFIIETARAVGEVKAKWNVEEAKDCRQKRETLSTLKPIDGIHSHSHFRGRVPLFVVTFESDAKLETIRQHLIDMECADAVFVLGVGAVFMPWHFDPRPDGQRDVNVPTVDGFAVVEGSVALLWMLLWLSSVMTSTEFVGVPPMSAYLEDAAERLGHGTRNSRPDFRRMV